MILNLFKTAEHLFSNKISPLSVCVWNKTLNYSFI